MSAKISETISKYLTNEKVLKALAVALVTLDEEYDGTIITNDKDFDTLNKFADVF